MLEYANEVSESLKLHAGYEKIKKKKKLKSGGEGGGNAAEAAPLPDLWEVQGCN